MELPGKTFVIDTNVLVHRPDAFLSFRDSTVVLPLWVLEELDKLKRDHAGRGRSARHAIREIDHYSKKGNLQTGVKLPSGGVLIVGLSQDVSLPIDLPFEKMDNKIILCALGYKQEGRDVFFVSKDINARIKAAALGIKAVDYEKNKVSMEHLFSGMEEAKISEKDAEQFSASGRISWEGRTLQPNEFVAFSEGKTVHIGRYDLSEELLRYVQSWQQPVLGIQPLNVKQRMAMDLLLDDSIPLVTLVGKAGTGKTLLALAAALLKTLEEKSYARVLVSRPIIPMGQDLGYLPGQKQAKMSHWMQPVFDNLEYIIESAKQQNMKSIDQLLNNKVIEIEAITYIRGRSLPRQYIIVDEAQNLTPHEVKTIVSRAGDGSKVVLTGDPYQIDSPYLDAESNGLTYLVEAFKEQSMAGHVTLAKSERSPLAELAAELL
ncbi:MAG: PhoH family protein [Spirochaetales bacterium]|nr:PhoH family protein [Spirochaetales bacterium]